MGISYLDLITGRDLNTFMRDSMLEVFPGLSTVNPAYKEKLQKMEHQVASYLEDKTLKRPFLYLVLGPPGAGKSYLVNCLTQTLKRKYPKTVFKATNLSEMVQPKELHGIFNRIRTNSKKGFFTITFLDEFDVKLDGGSAIKFLINPIYDGKFWDGMEFQTFGRCAFFFAGSYLQDRDTLIKTQKSLGGIDLDKFLADLFLEMHAQENWEAIRQISNLQEFCHRHMRWDSEADPRTDTTAYLTSLEKIKDFLSRIGGNILEMVDLSWPLGLTDEPFVIDGSQVHPSHRLKLEEVIAFVRNREEEANSFLNYESSHDPLVEYKNVLLCDRLARVLQALIRRFGKELKKQRKKSFEIDRRLLSFLTVVPLLNGMRSLEQLVSLINFPVNGQINCRQFDPDETAMVIQDNPKFGSPVQTWEALKENNPTMKDILSASESSDRCYISIPLS